jgi:UPF0271 protein
MIHDAQAAASRLIDIVATGLMPTLDGPPIRLEAHSICVHGDNEGAVAMARHIRECLNSAGWPLQPFLGNAE